jgi:hypothetical protein
VNGRAQAGELTAATAALRAAALLAAVLCGCAGAGAGAGKPGQPPPAAASGEMIPVDDSSHAVRFEVPPAAGGWQTARDGSARIGDSVQVEVASFPLARDATAASCRDTARARLSPPAARADDEGATPPTPRDQSPPRDPGSPAPPVDGPRDQTIGDSPTATWSFTRGSPSAALRSRWAFYPRGADCLMLEVTGALGDRFAETVFAAAARSFRVQPLSPEHQREVDLFAGMGFLERRDPASALERFEALARREPDFAKAHFGALMAGFELGPQAYARALPHGEASLKAERELSPEQRQLALRAVGVMQLAQDRVRNAADTLAELVVRAPDLAEGQYNYACALARLGDQTGALDHLAAALRLDASLSQHARGDEDFKSLRGTPRFDNLTRDKQAGADAARQQQQKQQR